MTKFYSVLLALVLAAVCASSLWAQKPAPKPAPKPVPKTDPKPPPKPVEIPIEVTTPPAESATTGVSFTLGGGYFMPQADMATLFKPSWMVKLSARNNNVSDTLFGIGCDLSYASLRDKQKSDGRMMYGTVFPHVTAAFSFFGLFDIIGKGGAGLSLITSKVNNKKNNSLSLTLGAGGGIGRVFGDHFIIGIEADYFYYMQRTPSKSLSGDMYMGYRM